MTDTSRGANGAGQGPEAILEAQQAGKLPDWVGRGPDRESRDGLLERFGGTKDVAGASEALCDEGAIVYDQTTPREVYHMLEGAGLPGSSPTDEDAVDHQEIVLDSFIGGRPLSDDWPYATRGNCYEFVHFAARIAGPQGARPHTGNRLVNAIDPATLEEWDFRSPIPRGKVIVGCVAGALGGQGKDGTYHFAVSLGDGWVANNRESGASKERLDDVFGGYLTLYRLPGGKVMFGDYACYAPKPEGQVAAEEAPTEPAKAPKSAREMQTVGRGIVGAVVAVAAAGSIAVAALLGGTDPSAPSQPVVGATTTGPAGVEEPGEDPADEPPAEEPPAEEPAPREPIVTILDEEGGVFMVTLPEPFPARPGPRVHAEGPGGPPVLVHSGFWELPPPFGEHHVTTFVFPEGPVQWNGSEIDPQLCAGGFVDGPDVILADAQAPAHYGVAPFPLPAPGTVLREAGLAPDSPFAVTILIEATLFRGSCESSIWFTSGGHIGHFPQQLDGNTPRLGKGLGGWLDEIYRDLLTRDPNPTGQPWNAIFWDLAAGSD